MEKPVGVNYIWGGDQENQSEGFGTLGFALLAAIILVYLVMVGLYDSFAHPFVLICHSALLYWSFISLGLDK
jgi:HAE1 family hydrophobic/amphiphilic exporter-1